MWRKCIFGFNLKLNWTLGKMFAKRPFLVQDEKILMEKIKDCLLSLQKKQNIVQGTRHKQTWEM